MMHAMRKMMAEFVRDNGRSESSSAEGSAEGSAAVGGSPRGLNPLLHEQLLLLLLEAWHEEIRQQEERRLYVRISRVISE